MARRERSGGRAGRAAARAVETPPRDAYIKRNIPTYSVLNDTHFLIFEKNGNEYNLYVSKYKGKNEVGVKKPEILELLIKNYDKSIPEHRLAITQYLK